VTKSQFAKLVKLFILNKITRFNQILSLKTKLKMTSNTNKISSQSQISINGHSRSDDKSVKSSGNKSIVTFNDQFTFKESSEIENNNSEAILTSILNDEDDFTLRKSLSFHPSLTLIRKFSKNDSVNQLNEEIEEVKVFDQENHDKRTPKEPEGGVTRVCKCAEKNLKEKKQKLQQQQ
jgi:hypothetical protein